MSLEAYVSLALASGVGSVRYGALLQKFGTPEAALASMPRANPSSGEKIVREVAELGGAVLVPEDERFPPALREIPDAPLLLFALGRLELLQRRAVAVIGSRSHTRYGAEVCRHFAGGLARAGLVVVSGMARGLDAIAHTAALDAKGPTVGVLGNGFGVIYPAANRALYQRVAREGCLLTEMPPGEKPHPGSFPRRNRLISGLARVTLVVEAGARSGTLLTVDAALMQGRDVLAVPGPITSPISVGCNRLIQGGAKPALGLRDVLEEYGIALQGVPSASLPTDLTPAERGVLDALAAGDELVDDIAARVGSPPGETLAVLTSLEIRGLIVQEPGKVFRRRSDLYTAT